MLKQLFRLKNLSRIINYKKYQDEMKNILITLNKYYYGKNNKYVIITEDSKEKLIINPFRFNDNSFNMYYNLFYFDNKKLNETIDDYLYGNFKNNSSIQIIKPNNISELNNVLNSNHSNSFFKYILINEKQSSKSIVENKEISTKIFLDNVLLSYTNEGHYKNSITLIDVRNSKISLENINLENIYQNNFDKWKFVITNRSMTGNDLEMYIKEFVDKIIIIGKYDENIIKNMINIFGNDFVIHENRDYIDVLDKMYLHFPELFVKKISQLETINMISNPNIYGKIAYISADDEYGNIQPIASGGNYIHYINYIDSQNRILKLLNKLIENNVNSGIFSCFNSNTRGVYLANLFLNVSRKENIKFNVYLMYPGSGHINICSEFNKATRIIASNF
jgi:hypothetical protein